MVGGKDVDCGGGCDQRRGPGDYRLACDRHRGQACGASSLQGPSTTTASLTVAPSTNLMLGNSL